MPARPIITLTTDFGGSDFYVAAMKAVLLRHCPQAVLIDITHDIYRHDLRSASFTLERAVSSFDGGTTHLAVVDPGVGTDRRMLILDVNGSTVICPDNGLITWTCRRYPVYHCTELIWRPPTCSNTFHGRDIMAPVAGMIAAGWPRQNLAGPNISPVMLEMDVSKTGNGEVIHIDHFGNATTNIPGENIPPDAGAVLLGDQQIPIRRTYAEVSIGEPVALIGSSDLLEIAVRNGSAAETLNLRIGTPVAQIVGSFQVTLS
jgi:S-adenosylmethionine hydrolase